MTDDDRESDEWVSLAEAARRLEACKLIGWSEIPTHPMEANELEAELVEIDENLMHSGMTVLELGEQLHRRREILLAMGEIAKVGDQPDSIPGIESGGKSKFAVEVAAQMGWASESSVYSRLRIAQNIPDDVKDIIRDTPIADSRDGLLELAQLKDDPEQQRKVAEIIAAAHAENGQAPSVAMAKSMLSEPDGRRRRHRRSALHDLRAVRLSD